jgi:carbon starvation protein
MNPGGAGPVAAFSAGLGEMIGKLGLPTKITSDFVALVVSAFALTSLDTATRLGRFAFQEFFEPRRDAERPARPRPLLARNRYIATLATVLPAGGLAYSGTWKQIWPIFGSANQLLAALALLAVTVWLAWRAQRTAFVKIPMVFMFLVTLSSLGLLARDNLVGADQNYVLGAMALVLLFVALVMAALAFKVLRRGARTAQAPGLPAAPE